MRKKLTKSEIEEIINLYKSGSSPKEIGEAFGILNNSVSRILRKHNVSTFQSRRLTQKETTFICNQYTDGYNTSEISKKLKIHPSTVCKVLKKNNIKIREGTDNKRKYFLNEEWLQEIDKEAKAYFIGLFLADGNISKSKNDISLRLHSQDKGVLERLSYYFYNENRVSSYLEDINKTATPVSKLCVYSKRIKSQLSEIGLKPNKSKTVKIPNIRSSLLPHFIRGLLDGDGCICIRPNGRVTVDFTGNKYIINSLQEILKEKEIFSSVFYSEKKDSWSLQINRVLDVEKFLDWIYFESNIYIERKYDKYRHFKNKRND